jgi:type III restriction enzyme
MSGPAPKDYQDKAITKLSDTLSRLLSVNTDADRLVVLKSPVGSGKTLTTAYALARTHDNPLNKPFIVLWLSPGRGKLHQQSARALKAVLAGSSLDVKLLDTRDDIVANVEPSSGTIFVVNWEKIRSEKDGEWSNKMLRPGETANLFTLLRNATEAGFDMISVIDESHTQLDGPQTTKLMAAIDELRPSIRIEISATPHSGLNEELRDKGIHNIVVVPFKSVEAEGMVRRSALLNDDFESVQTRHNDQPLDVQTLWGAWEKLEELTQRYELAGSTVKPLLLIQYPDGGEAKLRAEVVERFLEDRGLVTNQTYATWLSGDHSDDLDTIAQSTSPYRALLFKQAIATGWDCPRAQVLVQFRKPGSETFQIQTVGRIMRTPEQRHYSDEVLNVAYVYSDLAGVSVKVTSDEPDFTVRDLHLLRGSQYPKDGLKLTSIFQPRRREFHYPMTASLDPALCGDLDAKVRPLLTAEPPRQTTRQVLVDGSIAAADLMDGEGRFKDGVLVDGVVSEQFVQALFDQALTARIGPYSSKAQSRSRIKTSLIRWFQSATTPAWRPDEIQHFVIAHAGSISDAINTACVHASKDDEVSAIADARAKRRTIDEWEVPESERVPSATWVKSENKGLLVTPPFIAPGRSKPEERFERWLGVGFKQYRVAWWWRNGVRNERFLGIPYMDGENEEIAYPDYLVMSKSGTLWVVEIKDVGDQDGSVGGTTSSKARGFHAWARGSTRAVVAIPVDDGSGGIVVKMGDALSWTEPSVGNLATDNGWTTIDLS